ncbi:MAG: glycosyltransferase family 25 protein [Mesorhizobium sp.]|nr:glycosyltransferase family 25 protein [Mesorhizobium sp.]MBL8580123.1 glycosyltransferase family 25 protein [Mesorhizobium sp.]
MRALYINLDRSPERRQWIEQQAAALGLAVERIAAIDGAALDGAMPCAGPAGLSAGALACFHSHRKAWDMVVSGEDRYAAIFEDDVHMSPDLPRFLADTSWIPDDADIVHIERVRERCMVINRGSKVFGRKLYKTISENSGTGGYLISRACAQRLIEDFTEVAEEFDLALLDRNVLNLNIYKVEPALCIQDEFLEAPIFTSQIERRPRPKPLDGKLRREVARQIGKLKRGITATLGLKAPVRIRVGFR